MNQCKLLFVCSFQKIAIIGFFVSLYVYHILDEAVDDNDGDPSSLTVSRDGTWQRRGFKSIHGIAAVLSCNGTPKVFDIQRLSKNCLVCTGPLYLKNTNSDLYDEIIKNHDCESNYDGSSGNLGFVYQNTENNSKLNFF